MASKNQGSVNKGNQKGNDQKSEPRKVKAAHRASFKSMGGNPNPVSKKAGKQAVTAGDSAAAPEVDGKS